MNKELVKEGRQYQILLEGYTCASLRINGHIDIRFQNTLEDEWTTQLKLNNQYRLMDEETDKTFAVDDLEGLHKLINLWQHKVESMQASREGVLHLKMDNGTTLEVEDGPYENWEFLVYQKQAKLKIKTHLIGGVGRMVMI